MTTSTMAPPRVAGSAGRGAPPSSRPATARGSAPSATRTPISRVHRLTLYAITPQSPTAASTSAMTANAVSSAIAQRIGARPSRRCAPLDGSGRTKRVGSTNAIAGSIIGPASPRTSGIRVSSTTPTMVDRGPAGRWWAASAGPRRRLPIELPSRQTRRANSRLTRASEDIPSGLLAFHAAAAAAQSGRRPAMSRAGRAARARVDECRARRSPRAASLRGSRHAGR
ncbi:MAG TPA: hypothetical protein VFS08_13760 [Gemmatimonadaceae bacterium]|nr:hypothetical protein [Gemmatimonadaceae bacterium]